MINYFDGTVFNTEAQALVNTVNCVGFMGAGLAFEFMLRYPDMYADYKQKCKEKKIVTGKLDYYTLDDGKIVISFPTKRHFKYPSQVIWIEQGLEYFVNTYEQYGIQSVAFPKLGTNFGGLDWHHVRELMEQYLSKLDIDIYICLNEKKSAEGIEKAMLDKFNHTGIERLTEIAKLKSNQRENIRQNIPYYRFWEIYETPTIGRKTYARLYQHFYGLAINNTDEPRQVSFFD